MANPVTPLRTRGKQQRSLGFFEIGLQAKDVKLMQQYVAKLLKPEHHLLQVLPIGHFPAGPAVSIIVVARPNAAASQTGQTTHVRVLRNVM